MAERPILFSTPMVRAILDGRKTQTRRPIKAQVPRATHPHWCIGDVLWVRETWKPMPDGRTGYRASPDETCVDGPFVLISNWKPSIHMPRSRARLFLLIQDVRTERLRDMTNWDMAAEGCSALGEFPGLWDSIYADRGYSWESNPWVWAVAFRRIAPEEE